MHDFPNASKEIEVTVEISTRWLLQTKHRGNLVRTGVRRESAFQFFFFFLSLLEKTLSVNKIISSCFIEYKFHSGSLATLEEKVETYHYIAEALKFGNMLRPHMGDPAFSETQVSSMVCWYSATALSNALTCSFLQPGRQEKN